MAAMTVTMASRWRPTPTATAPTGAEPAIARSWPSLADAAAPPRGSSRAAVRVRRRVAALQPDLVRALALVLDEELRVDVEPAALRRVELDHPPRDPLGVELPVPRRVQRVGQEHPPPVARD